MKLKKLFIFLLLLPLGLMAQKSKPWNKLLYDAKPYHFGFSFSGGMLDFNVKHMADFGTNYDSIASIEGQGKPIFGAHIVGVLKLNEDMDLRFSPGLAFGQRDLNYIMIDEIEFMDTLWRSHIMKIESTYLQFPIAVKYRAMRQSNYRPYFLGGINYGLDLASRKKVEEEEKPKILLNRHDFMVEVGFGVDYYLSFFKFSTELKFSYGFMNIVNYDNMQQTQVFDKLSTKMITLAIFFE